MTAAEIITELSKLARNHGTEDKRFEPIDTIQLVPRPAMICDEETQI